MNDVVFHIGLHKTATGTLQRQFFPACSDLNLLTTRVSSAKRFIEYMTRTDPVYCDRQHAKELIKPVLDEEKPNMISNESLSGPPYAGIIENGLHHRSPILQNMKKVYPQAKIILVLRRQDGLARSFYRQYLKSGGTRTMDRFYGLTDGGSPPLFAKDRFRFKPYVDAIHELFSSGVLVLTYEEFVRKPDQFLETLARFGGFTKPDLKMRRENATALGPVGQEVTRYLNHLFRSRLNPGGVIPGFLVDDGGPRRRVSPVQLLHDHWPGRRRTVGRQAASAAATILDSVREDNRELDRKYNLDLSEYGYY